MSSRTNLNTCAVPMCQNSTLSTPNKILFHLPTNRARRNKWLNVIGLNIADFPPSVHRYCCEDHFDLPNDAENWIKHSITQCKIRLKNDAVPHKFECPPTRKRTISTTVFEDVTKRIRTEFVDVTASSTSTLTEYATEASSSGNMFGTTNIETLNVCNKPSTSDTTSSNNTCGIQFNLSDKPFLLTKGVQVKPRFRSKYVQCTGVFKNDITD